MSKAKDEIFKLLKILDSEDAFLLNNLRDAIDELEQQKAELIDVMEKIRGLCKSKAVNNHLNQIFLISDITLNKLQKGN